MAEKRSSDGPNRGEKEIASRRDAALLRALSTPHKRQKEMKVGKPGGTNPVKSEVRPTVLEDTLFAKIGAHVGNDLDPPEDPSSVSEALECSRRLFENIRRGLRGDDIDFDKVLEKLRDDRRVGVA